MIPQSVTPEDNCILLSHFSSYEIRPTIFDMHPDKSLGPDGMNSDFFPNVLAYY